MGKCMFMRKGEVHTKPSTGKPQSSLPAGAKRLQYIRSDGRQWLDTRFTPNQDTRVVMDVDVTSYPNSYPALFGTRASSWKQNSFAVFCVASGNKMQDQYGDEYVADLQTSLLGRHTIDKNKNVTSVDGTVVRSFTYTDFQTTQSLFLLESHNPSGAESYPCAADLYFTLIFDNGFLERDYIPCQLASGEVGMWDDVYGEFYGDAAGVGFIAGPEATDEWKYTELEYVQSSGSQYVDTQFKPNQDTSVTADFQLRSASAWQCVFGTRVGANTASYSLWHSGSVFGFYYASANASFSNLVATDRHVVVATKNIATADGESKVSLAYSNFTANYSLCFFAVNTAGTIENFAYMDLHTGQVYDNGTPARDYVSYLHPAGIPGLWDKVNRRFYASATTTDFVSVVKEAA